MEARARCGDHAGNGGRKLRSTDGICHTGGKQWLGCCLLQNSLPPVNPHLVFRELRARRSKLAMAVKYAEYVVNFVFVKAVNFLKQNKIFHAGAPALCFHLYENEVVVIGLGFGINWEH